MGYDAWNIDPKRTGKYQKADTVIQSQLADFLKRKKKKEYYELQIKYWDIYYKSFPEYLPPTINSDKPVYQEYLHICADYSTNAAFDPEQAAIAKKQQHHQQKVEYIQVNGEAKVESKSFFRMMDHYIEYLKDSFKVFYETPEYAIMHKLLPRDANLKMKTSTLVQTWLPYLTEEDAKKFMEQTGFTQEYVDIPKVKAKESTCIYCKQALIIPEGAIKVHCENCHKTNNIKEKFNCMSCGQENTIPDVPVNTIDCVSCNTENRLIKPLFS